MAESMSPFPDSSKRLPRRPTVYDTGGDATAASRRLMGATSTTVPRPRTTSTTTPNPYLAASTPATASAPFAAAAAPPISGIGAAVANAAPAAQGFGSSGYPGAGTEPMRGWAKSMGYTPADVMGMNQMPARYLYDILQNRGMDPTGGLFYMMEPLADVMMPLFETIYGGNRDITQGFEANDIANFMGQLFGEYMSPGGRGADISELFSNLLNPGGENSILNSYLNQGTPEEQVENFRRYAMMLGQLSGSPMYQQALSNRLSESGYDFLSGFQGGQSPTGTFGQLVRNPGF